MRGAATAARLALATAFASAVADRFGLWGAPGEEGVAWGAWRPFVEYTGALLWFLPGPLVEAAALTATTAEAILAGGLIVNARPRVTGAAAAGLLATFGLAMAFAHGPKAPLDYSVFSAAAAALLLAAPVQGNLKPTTEGEHR